MVASVECVSAVKIPHTRWVFASGASADEFLVRLPWRTNWFMVAGMKWSNVGRQASVFGFGIPPSTRLVATVIRELNAAGRDSADTHVFITAFASASLNASTRETSDVSCIQCGSSWLRHTTIKLLTVLICIRVPLSSARPLFLSFDDIISIAVIERVSLGLDIYPITLVWRRLFCDY